MVAKLSQKTSSQLLLEYCKNINEWPNRWAVNYADIQVGKNINEYFKLFLIDRIKKNCTKSTIKIYARYLLVLGAELIGRINDDYERQLSSKDFILKHVDSSGGLSWHHVHDSFEGFRYNSVCKQFFKFITNEK